MKAFHVICGLPRSGSTLLCNVLAQNPAFHVLHTSPLPMLIDHLAQGATETPEVKGLLQQDVSKADETISNAARAIVHALHPGKKTCFDKNRFWNVHQFVLAELFPDAKIICCIRDLRAIFGSFERHWRRQPLLQVPPGYTIRARMQNQFSNQGMIGSALDGIEDLMLIGNMAVLFVKYEELVARPESRLREIYEHIGEPWFDHDFEKVKSTAIDPDWLYLNKFPHDGSGKVEDKTDWHEYVPRRIAEEIVGNYRQYYEAFRYV